MTDAQWRLFHRFNDLCREMRKEKMLFVRHDGNLKVFNGASVADYVFPEDICDEENEVEVKFNEVPSTELDMFYFGSELDETFGVRFE